MVNHLRSIPLIFRTVRHLKFIQVLNRFYRRLYCPRVNLSPTPALRLNTTSIIPFIKRPVKWDGENSFTFLNETRQVTTADDWNKGSIPKLWLYHLHYFDDLCRPDAELFRVKHSALISRWIKENPPAQGNGWEPYPISIRSVNWIKWALSGAILDDTALHNLAVQIRLLANRLEYHLLGNHLWANGKALIFAGLFFKGPEADKWLQKGLRIVEEQLSEQVLSDGGHFEKSTSYHAIFTEDLLDLICLSRQYEGQINKNWESKASALLRWLFVMTRPDGKQPLFNDASHDMAPSFTHLENYAKNLEVIYQRPVFQGLTMLESSGYFRWDGENYSTWVDAGSIGPDYIPGHAHADIFNFELFSFGHPVIIDTGISTYELGDVRHHERGTAAHNTVQLGTMDQSEMWASFRVGRRARTKDVLITSNTIEGAHTGYDRFGARHHRKFTFTNNSIAIEDVIIRKSCSLPAFARFHLAAGQQPVIEGNLCRLGKITLLFQGYTSLTIEEDEVAIEFNLKQSIKCIIVKFDSNLITLITL